MSLIVIACVSASWTAITRERGAAQPRQNGRFTAKRQLEEAVHGWPRAGAGALLLGRLGLENLRAYIYIYIYVCV